MADPGRGELRERVAQLTNQLAAATVRSDRLQDEANRLESSVAEKSRSLAQAQQSILRLETASKENDALKSEIARLRDKEDRFYAQFEIADRMVKTTLATNVQSMIADAGLLRLVLRTGLSDQAIDAVRRTTKSDLADIRKILAEVPSSISAADSEVTARAFKDIEVYCRSIDRFAAEFGGLDPIEPPIPEGSKDEIVSAALLNYGFKKQLYALEMGRVSSLVRDDELIQRIQDHANQLEASAQEIRKIAMDLAPPAVAGYIKARDVSTQSMISILRSQRRPSGEALNRKDR